MAWKIRIIDEAQKDYNMNIVVISPRDDNYCYELAKKVYAKYGKNLFKDIFDNL